MAQMNKRRGRETAREAACCGGLASLFSPRLFKALADPTRLSLLVRLAEQRTPCTVSHLAKGSGVDLSVVSRHLAVLRDAGIIGCAKHGKEVCCTVQTTAVVGLLRELADAFEACCPTGICPPKPAGSAGDGRCTTARRTKKDESHEPRTRKAPK